MVILINTQWLSSKMCRLTFKMKHSKEIDVLMKTFKGKLIQVPVKKSSSFEWQNHLYM